MRSHKKSPVLERLAWVYEFGLVWVVAWLLLVVWSGGNAHAADPILVYETALPDSPPSLLIIYEDGQVERDFFSEAVETGRLDARQMGKVNRLVEAVLTTEIQQTASHIQEHRCPNEGEVSLSVTHGSQSRVVSWRPVAGLDYKPVTFDLEDTLAQIIKQPLRMAENSIE